jgi:hypothetical protein
MPAHPEPSREPTLPLSLVRQAPRTLVLEPGLEVLVPPLLVLESLGFEQRAGFGIESVVLDALGTPANLVAPPLGRARHLSLVGPGLLGHAGGVLDPMPRTTYRGPPASALGARVGHVQHVGGAQRVASNRHGPTNGHGHQAHRQKAVTREGEQRHGEVLAQLSSPGGRLRRPRTRGAHHQHHARGEAGDGAQPLRVGPLAELFPELGRILVQRAQGAWQLCQPLQCLSRVVQHEAEQRKRDPRPPWHAPKAPPIIEPRTAALPRFRAPALLRHDGGLSPGEPARA